MAAYVDGEGGIPVELQGWLRISAWGDPWGVGWMGWPARWFAGVRLARNVYEAWRGYTGAKDRVGWLNSHRGQGAETVGWVKELRRGVVSG